MATSSSTSAKSRTAREQDLKKLTAGFRSMAVFLFIVSGVINILALTGSFYMMQVYDRALTSGSIPTLIALSVLALGLYVFQGAFDLIRSQVLVRVGARFDRSVAPIAHKVVVDMPRLGFSTTEAIERGRDVDTVRNFLGSTGPGALFDLPWVPIYVAFVYILHPWLGALVLGGAVVLTMLALASELVSRRHAVATRKAALVRNTIADSNARNAEVLKAMGFAGDAVERFRVANMEHLALQTRSNDLTGAFGAVSRVLRMVLQSATLGLGAYLTIHGDMSAGGIIAASVAGGRALAPVDLAIGNWRGFVGARQAFGRLRETIVALGKLPERMELPAPCASLKVEKITVAAPGNGQVLLSEVAFEIRAGQAAGIIGPSAGGKTTLVRALTGIWPCLRGAVRLDDAEIGQWTEEAIGRHLGYLPQNVCLLDATVAQNISRLASVRDDAAVVEAAKAAGVHEMILRLPEGYQTPLGSEGAALSAGQRQRIGLARALYGNPFLVVLDEPNANLDSDGETALRDAITAIRARGGICVVVAHRPSALAAVDLVGLVQNGRLAAFGPKEEVLRLEAVDGRTAGKPQVAPVQGTTHETAPTPLQAVGA
ncbi:type I secretion system permease/ATPase [Xanthobacter oligotrophicus]|uniref:type I secretion system permease/ATPase n=1 Tax=Xanthobacter oligotrophicus TaxID=2607286 RepID=UPI0011F0BCB3|nr:type I secretion system permease/ATPase [Xanthobacter oligotrophicus]MCG5234277.1 type I secretion system permease/ATPase [Xanthobacter oligotrophicus]